MSAAGILELRFCLQWAFKYAPLSHVSLSVSCAFLYYVEIDLLLRQLWLMSFGQLFSRLV